MNLSFRNRIALFYLIATAFVMTVVFGIVYVSVRGTVYQNIDKDLAFEARKHAAEISVIGDSIYFTNKAELEEHEHREVQVNPVFIQIMNADGRLMDKSPNLKGDLIPFKEIEEYGTHFNAFLKERAIRQVQIPIEKGGELKGYIVAAMSLEASLMVIQNLRNVLLISYPISLLALFFVSRYMAGQSISPVKHITETTQKITKNQFHKRVQLPANKDELYDLSTSINELLQRIEQAIDRERQFTSDASHELRTPLSSLRGTLEVLIRKPRQQEEYEEKIRYGLAEIDRMTGTIEQLLLLARLDSDNHAQKDQYLPLDLLCDSIISHHQRTIEQRHIEMMVKQEIKQPVAVPQYYASLILENLIGNAVKYSPDGGSIHLTMKQTGEDVLCSIQDHGIGIREEDLEQVFHPFFRSEALSHKHISGNGLGLSIAKKAADAIGAEVKVSSQPGKGSTFTLRFFKPILR
ncbi:MAG: HAMP domain-containing histidine kinase [Bacteroidia bacterium]|nr:HAMP domain-containing histidine kinase [Bacteroidia bacterium]